MAGPDPLRVGVIGLGVMGAAMARRIAAAGHLLAVSVISHGPVIELCGRGAVALDTDPRLPVFAVVAEAFDELERGGRGDLDRSALVTLLGSAEGAGRVD